MGRVSLRLGQVILLVAGFSSIWFWGRWYLAGRDYQLGRREGFRSPALVHLKRAVSRAPWWGEAQFGLGRTLMGREELVPALEAYRLAASTHFDFSLELSWGWTLEQSGKLEEALQHYRRGLAYSPRDEMLRQRLVVALITRVHQILAGGGQGSGSVVYRGMTFRPEDLSRGEDLLAEADRATSEFPDLAGPVLEGQAFLALIRGQPDRAARLLARRIESEPYGLMDPLLIRWTLLDLGDRDRELAVLRRELQTARLGPDTVRARLGELQRRGFPSEESHPTSDYILGLARLLVGESGRLPVLDRIPPDSAYAGEARRLQELAPGDDPRPGGGGRPLYVFP